MANWKPPNIAAIQSALRHETRGTASPLTAATAAQSIDRPVARPRRGRRGKSMVASPLYRRSAPRTRDSCHAPRLATRPRVHYAPCMCGRISLGASSIADVADFFGARVAPEEAALYRPRYNVAPTQRHWIVRLDAGERRLVFATWGFP